MATGDRTLRITILGDAKGAQQAFSDTESSAGGLASKLGGLVTGLGGGLAIFDLAAGGAQKLGEAVSGLIEPATQAQQIQAQTAAVIKSTGDASGMTAEQIDRLAAAQENQGTFSRETIEQGENMLLTFTNIGKKTFPDATSAIVNMTQSFQAAGKSMNISDIAILVGKALNDPVKGITALQRVGVTLSAQQKQQVADFMKVGDVAHAQAVIIGELNHEFGGSGAAAADTYAGKMAILRNKLEDAKVAAGEALLPILAKLGDVVLPLLTRAFDALPAIMEAMVSVGERLAERFRGPVTTALSTAALIVGRLREEWGFLVENFKSDGVTGALRSIATSIVDIFGGLGNWIGHSLLPKLGQLGGDILATLVKVFRAIHWEELGIELLRGLGLAFQRLKGTFSSLTGDLAYFATYLVQAFVALFRSIKWNELGTALMDGIGKALALVQNVGSQALGFGTSLLASIVADVKSVDWSSVGETNMTARGNVVSQVKAVGSRALGFGAALLAEAEAEVKSVDWSGIASAISQGIDKAFSATGLSGTIPGLQFLLDHKDDVIAALTGITGAFIAWTVVTKAQAFATQALTVIQAAFDAVMSASPIGLIIIGIAAASVLLYEAWKHNFGGIQQKTQEVLSFLSSAIPPVWDAIQKGVSTVVTFVKTLIDGDWAGAWGQLGTLVTHAKDLLVNTVLPAIWDGLKTFFLETLPKIEAQLLDWGLAFVRWVAPQIPPLLVELGKLLDQLGGWIINTALPDIGTKLLEWGRAFIAWVGPQIPPLLLELGKLELELVKWVLLTALPDIIAQLVQWGLAFVAWVAPHIADLLIELGKLELQVAQWIILTALPDIIKQLVQWGGAFVGWVAGATTDLLNALPGLASSVITWIGNQADPTQSGTIAAKMLDAGKTAGTSLVDGILGGIKAAWHTLTDWLSQNPLNVVSKLIGGGGGPPAASSSGSAGSPPGGIAAEGARIIAMAETTAGAYGWCEKFVGDTMDRMGLHYTRALSAQAHSTMQPLNPGLGPEGAIVFYPWGSEGHVAFSMGDGQHIYGTLDTPSGTGESNGYWAQPYGWTVNPAMNGLFVKGGPALVLSNENPGNHEGEVTAPVPMLRGVVRDELKKALKGGGGSGMSVHLHGDLHVQQAPGATDQLLDALLARL